MPKLQKRTRSPSPDHHQLSEPEMSIEDLNVEVDANFDANEQAAFDEEVTNFYIRQIDKELAGTFWALEDEADELFGVSCSAIMFTSNSQLTLSSGRNLLT